MENNIEILADLAERELGGKILERVKIDCRKSWAALSELKGYTDDSREHAIHNGAFLAGAASATKETQQ